MDYADFQTKDGHTAKTTSGKYGYIFRMFQTTFPDIAELTRVWTRNDGSSIEIELKNHQKFIYTYKNEGDWCFQTKKHYMNELTKQRVNIPKRKETQNDR